MSQNSLADKWTLFFWQWRDTDQCEFFSFPLLLLALGLGITQRRPLLVRGCAALFAYAAVITLVSPQRVSLTPVADIRYLAPLIPLGIFVEAAALCAFFEGYSLLLAAAAVVAFGTNLLNGGPFLRDGLRSTLISYLGELAHPPIDPYAPTADWINEHIPEGSFVCVLPTYATYSLMIRAPRALYGWQLSSPPKQQFAGLPAAYFVGQSAPDYVVVFGPVPDDINKFMQTFLGLDVTYTQVATINVYWMNAYRPELFQREFEPITKFDPNKEAVFVFKRTEPPLAAGREMQ